MNICDVCNIQLNHRVSTVEEPYLYTECGLPSVLLLNIDVYTCPECGIEVADIPNVEGLHRLLTREILLNPVPMTGQEFRFLRKEVGMKPKTFAERIGADPKTITNWENSAVLSKQNDLLVRYIVATNLLKGVELQKVITLINEVVQQDASELNEKEIAELAQENTLLGITGLEWEIGPHHTD